MRYFTYILFLIFPIISVVIQGCGNEPDKSNAEVVFRLALQPDPENKVWVAADTFKRELEHRSDGRIRVMFYDSAVLGAERQLLESCYFGIIEMVQVTSSVVTTIDPLFSILDMPYLFFDEAHHQKALNGPIGQELLDDLNKVRFQGLAFYSCGFRHIFNSKRPVYSPDDMKGLKIRVMESPVMLRSINCMGGSATPLSASELYSALKTGVVDGAENNPRVFISAHFCDACKFLSLTGHFVNQHVLIANKSWLESLKPEYRQMIRDTAKDILPEYNRAWNASVEEAMAQMKKQGVTVNDVTGKKAFVGSVQPIYDEYANVVPPELVRRIRKEAEDDHLLPDN
ncbi:MAG: TRAP transporter substrate-binding protein [Candidatus Latescibacteria bacterium]|nr:TRAP transporter substrate-binding protein [Candidatus Latescibacterota bacterium]